MLLVQNDSPFNFWGCLLEEASKIQDYVISQPIMDQRYSAVSNSNNGGPGVGGYKVRCLKLARNDQVRPGWYTPVNFV